MLNESALNASIPLVTICDNHNVIVTPIPGSPLEVIVNATRSDIGLNIASTSTVDGVEITSYVPDIKNIEYLATVKDPVLNICPHDQAMDSIVELVANNVKEHIVFARTVVAPAVEDLVTRVSTSLNELTPSTLLGMEVVIFNPPAPLLNSSLEDAVRVFLEVSFDIPNINLRLPTLSADEIIELMTSGSGNLDNSIKEWAATKGSVFFTNIWENLFQIKQAELTDTTIKTFRDWTFNCPDELDNALAIFLLSRKLVGNPLPETDMNLNTYNSTIVEYRNQSAARLCIAINDLIKAEKAGIIVRSVFDRTTVVNGSVYNKWLDNGGSVEILYGNLLSKLISVTADDLLSRADELKSLWDKHAVLTASVERNRLFARTKELLSKHFTAQLREVNEGDDSTLENKVRITALFEECLYQLREDEISDLWDSSLKLLCHSRFNKTDARGILLGIERVKKDNPNADVRECAAISVIEYIAKWISTQLKVTVI